MSLCIVLDSGLGNQLFMLFTGISKAIDENINFSIYPIYNTFRKFFFTNFLKSLLFKVEPNPMYNEREVYQEPHFHYKEIPRGVKLIKGYFQSPKYFHHNRNKIIKILEIDNFLNKFKLDFNAIAIHLRFGDMSFNQGNHIILKPIYFINAIKKMKELVNMNDYKFLIFAEKEDNEIVNDYIDEFNKEFDNSISFTKFYDLFPNMRDYEELCYMSSCKHFIIANSTFSWFSAYLNNDDNKFVICPNEWFGPKLLHNNTKDLYLENWIKI